MRDPYCPGNTIDIGPGRDTRNFTIKQVIPGNCHSRGGLRGVQVYAHQIVHPPAVLQAGRVMPFKLWSKVVTIENMRGWNSSGVDADFSITISQTAHMARDRTNLHSRLRGSPPKGHPMPEPHSAMKRLTGLSSCLLIRGWAVTETEAGYVSGFGPNMSPPGARSTMSTVGTLAAVQL